MDVYNLFQMGDRDKNYLFELWKNENNDTVFIYPTDTVWGIGGSIWSQDAYDKVCDIKGTGRGKPLSIIVSDEEMLNEFVKTAC